MKDITKLLQDILGAISSIETYSVQTYDAFLEDEKVQDAIMFNLIIRVKPQTKFQMNFKKTTQKFPGHLLLEREMSSCMDTTR